MEGDWDTERLNAAGLLRCLSEEYLEEETKRRGLSRRWPEAPDAEAAVSSSDSERYITERFLRNDNEDSFRLLETFVKGSVNQLLQANSRGEAKHVTSGQLEIVQALLKLSDRGVLEAAPGLLKKLERRALLSIYAILSGDYKPIRNRPYLLEKLREKLKNPYREQCQEYLTGSLQDVLDILRDPGSYKARDARRIEVKASSPVKAAYSALMQADQLPLKGLLVMLETLRHITPSNEIGTLIAGSNKDRLTSFIWSIAQAQLSGLEDDDELPESLRKCLIVMSLSARYAYGGDGKLIDFLGPISSEAHALHSTFLSALSEIKYMNTENLSLIFEDLVGSSKVSSKRRAITFRHTITTILLDCLLRSEMRPIPEDVQKVVEKLRFLIRQQSGWKMKVTRIVGKNDVRERSQLELEAALRVSSHLQQIMFDMIGYPQARDDFLSGSQKQCNMDACSNGINHGTRNATMDGARQTLQRSPDCKVLAQVGTRTVQSSEDIVKLEYGSYDDVGPPIEQISMQSLTSAIIDASRTRESESRTELQQGSDHEVAWLAEAKWLRELSRVGDEAAGVGYTLIGCALEEMSRLTGQILVSPVRSYLRSGAKRTYLESGMELESEFGEQDQVSFILRLAQSNPRISRRTMDRVRGRLLR